MLLAFWGCCISRRISSPRPKRKTDRAGQALHGPCWSQRTVAARKRAQVQTLLPSSPGRRGRPPRKTAGQPSLGLHSIPSSCSHSCRTPPPTSCLRVADGTRRPALSEMRPKRSPAQREKAKPFPGSAPRPRFAAVTYRTAITEKLDAGLSRQRIWQDLFEEYGYGASYESVRRFVRTLAPLRRAVRVFHCWGFTPLPTQPRTPQENGKQDRSPTLGVPTSPGAASCARSA